MPRRYKRAGAALLVAVLLTAQASIPALSESQISKASSQNNIHEQWGTDETPLVVKLAPAQRSGSDIAKEDAREQETLNASTQLTKLTGDLAHYTFELFIATSFLALLTVGLVLVGFRQVSDARKSIAAAVSAAKAAKDQVALGREEFLAANRPHLTVRNVHALDAEPGDPIQIKYEVINNGAADAYIVGSSFETNFVPQNETFHDLHFPGVGEPPKNLIGNIVLPPGAIYRGEFKLQQLWTPDHFHNHSMSQAGFFWGGKILYRDATGRPRRLGVYRRLSLPSRRFRPVNDPEFEYDD